MLRFSIHDKPNQSFQASRMMTHCFNNDISKDSDNAPWGKPLLEIS